jgi:tetratricopeptide (TPR) repeat protein
LYLAGTPRHRPGAESSSYRLISANDPETQRLFDRGLQMLYAGNSAEARRLFGLAVASEPQCAMAHWGYAVSFATSDMFDIFTDTSFSSEVAFAQTMTAANASLQERRLIHATSARFGALPLAALRRRYAEAMRDYVGEFPEDFDGIFLSCLATFQAHAWELSSAEASHLLPDLDRMLEVDPSHDGAHFLRIKVLELLGRTEEGESDAASLAETATSPGLGQLLHRAAHVRAQRCRLDEAIDLNLSALRNNYDYFEAGDEAVTRWMRGFHSHVVSTVTYQLALVGRYAEAEEIARRESPILLAMVALRQRKWHDVVALGPVFLFSYAIACARLGDRPEAERVAALLRAEPQDYNFRVQLALIAAAVARSDDDFDEELRQYAVAYVNSDFHYDPPLYWSYPVVEGYGSALIRAHEYGRAEELFSSMLKRTPYDPYIAAGLDFARKLQKKPVDNAWHGTPLIGDWGARLVLADLG